MEYHALTQETGRTAKEVPRFVGRRRRSRSWPCPHPSTFAILVVHELHDITLQLSGTLDAGNRSGLVECAESAVAEQPRRLVLELSALDEIDADGVSGLFQACESARAAGVDALFDSPSAAVREVLLAAMPGGDFPIR